MRGRTTKHIGAENLLAMNPYLGAKQAMSGKRKTCWACQKNKFLKDGHLDIRPGLFKFVCADCIAAKKAKHEVPPVQSTD